MSRRNENTGFTCAHCGRAVPALTNGSYRNHCPYCLYSLHTDNIPGDRMNACHGLMKPVDICFHGKKGYQLVHRCQTCGVEKRNRLALDSDCPDDMDAIIAIMRGSDALHCAN